MSLHCSSFSTSLWIDWHAVSLLFVWNFRFGGAFQDVPLFHTPWKDFGHHHIRESLKEFICALSLSIKLSFSLAIMSCKDFVVVHHRNVLVLPIKDQKINVPPPSGTVFQWSTWVPSIVYDQHSATYSSTTSVVIYYVMSSPTTRSTG